MRARSRWTVCALLFFATTVNYLDRQILAILAPLLQTEIGWSESEYGLIVTSFQAAYALGLLGAGRLLDLMGVAKGYPLAVTLWSLAAMAHAAARSAFGFGVARFALGLGEGGNFPAAVKAIAEWFPKQERALATGLFNAGSNVGAIAAPLLVPWIALQWGWRWAFLATGASGFLWVILWVVLYRAPATNKENEAGGNVPWLGLCRSRQTLGLVAARFLTDPVWWFYLYWVPKFLYTKHGIALDRIGPPLVTVYLAADFGSVFGGWLSSWLMKRGWTVSGARKTAMFVCALMVAPIMFASEVDNLWTAVALLGLATAGHQGWAANIFTLVSDLYPQRAVSSVVGICGFGASIGGMVVSTATGFLLELTGSYLPVFVWAGTAYFGALLVIHVTCYRGDPETSNPSTSSVTNRGRSSG
ncbi:MAG: MFS transporter [Bryobacterales bacterium]|nr:MFS transporter [Bryobacterales bacterium]